MQRAAHAYLQTQVTTTSPGNILILLYDGAIKFLNRAKEGLAANDMAGKGIAISKTLDIINELDSTLNLDKGGDLAANLHNLYFFCNSRLVMANLKKDAKIIDEVIKILAGLRSAYAEIVSLPEAQAAAQATAANMHPTAAMPPRAQAGTSPSGGAAPAPGASARIRSMHAMNQQNAAGQPVAGDAASRPVSGESGLSAEAKPSAAPLAAQPAADVAQPVSAVVPPAPCPDAQAAPPAPEMPMPRGFGGNALAARRAGSEMYRKFAGQ